MTSAVNSRYQLTPRFHFRKNREQSWKKEGVSQDEFPIARALYLPVFYGKVSSAKVWFLVVGLFHVLLRRGEKCVLITMTEPVLAIDEYGRPFIILKDQSTKTRLHGSEAIKVRIMYNFVNVKCTKFGARFMNFCLCLIAHSVF